MPSSRTLYWTMFRQLSRVVGVAFVGGGIIFSIWGAWLLFDREAALMVDGVPTRDPAMKAVVLASGVVVAVLGSLLLRSHMRRDEPKA